MTKRVEAHDAFVGALCVWMHIPRGGYGYEYPVNAKIVSLSPHGDMANIAVEKKDGEIVHRIVKTSSLRWRT